ncbi:MAG: hypothetical protein HETSPECPRED_009445 [Heterodermia speciosa]|uniref:F5/8 type C domain-containing protein n=1 Tax=Heterodermia speciosa TaxID=116794 RepID=A0A8H3G5M5_9LECA|nr:MAG: hypothetical protein HETSPECPRED_009445 [Heterodermia speciosa]
MRTTILWLLCPILSSAAPQLKPAHALAVGTSATLDGVRLDMIAAKPSVAEVVLAAIPRDGWTVTCDSSQPGNDCSNAIDDNSDTFWLTDSGAPLPHSIVVDMKTTRIVGNITIQPRQDNTPNGHIGEHQVFLSEDGENWGSPIAIGTYLDDANLKTTIFTPANARYVKVTSLSEAGGRDSSMSLAELNVYEGTALPPSPATAGSWGLTIDFPVIPVSAAIEWSSGRLLVWSSFSPSNFVGDSGHQTSTAIYDPATQLVSARTITNTNHDMFCEGLSMDAEGRIVAVGGNSDYGTSIYDSTSDSWTAGGDLKIPRGYQSQATLSDGRLFTIGASWSGGSSTDTPKNGEIYDTATNTWTALPGCPVTPMLTSDPEDKSLGHIYRGDNHGWLFGWKDGSVFQAGPAVAMNWYGTDGTGSQSAAGSRASDTDSMCGNAIMYDAVAGSILTLGGAPNYVNSYSTANAHIITLSDPNVPPTVTTLPSMAFPRAFHNSIILPNGQVFITGGQHLAIGFTDQTPQLIPELFDPTTQSFTQMAPLSIPRNYHSTGLLLPDATVFNGGGGLCGDCAANHFDAQIYSPAYLFNPDGSAATRPMIESLSAAELAPGASLTVQTSGPEVTAFALVRLSSTTHTVNTDQRRIALERGEGGTVTLPADPGVALPGYWYLFALAEGGVPSLAKFVKVTTG